MQSGHLTHKVWILLFPQREGISIDPIMQWISQTHPGQRTMHFDSKESAMTYCERYHITPIIQDESSMSSPQLPKSYAENFTKNFRW